MTSSEKARRGIQSIEIGSHLLKTLSDHGEPMALRDLALASGVAAGKAHPYLVSFCKVGFVTQDPASNRYELGPLALELGLAKLRRIDAVKEASKVVGELAAATSQGVAVAVWGNLGPTIVQLEEPARPLHVNLRIGTVMSLLHTATGRLFATYMPPRVVEDVLAADSMGLHYKNPNEAHNDTSLQQATAEVRKRGLARALGQPIPGINAFCAPVFDSNGHIALGILIMGAAPGFDSDWDGDMARKLLDCASEVSKSLGYRAVGSAGTSTGDRAPESDGVRPRMGAVP